VLRKADAAGIATDAGDLSSLTHAGELMWNMAKDAPETRFFQEDDAVITGQKLAMISAVQATLAAGLGILGVTPIDEMR